MKRQQTLTQPSPSTTILVVNENRDILDSVRAIADSTHTVLYARDTRTAQRMLDKRRISVLICNERLGKENSLRFMARANKAFPLLQPVLMSESINEDLMAIAINEVGVLKYLKLPLQESQLREVISSALAHHLQALEIEALKENYQKALREMRGLPYLARRVRQTTRILLHNVNDLTAAAAATVAVMLGIFFIMGIAILIGLYVLKTSAGIDLFIGFHLSDIVS